MSLAQALWKSNLDGAQRTLAHPFVRGLGDGSLPVSCFKRYVAQDAYFLEAFARAYAFCLAHSRSRQDLYDFAQLIVGVLDELKLHAAYAERWSVDLAHVVPGTATRAYVDFLLETARTGELGETIAAMTPCMRLYAFLGQTLSRGEVAPLYADWVKTYADPGFETLASQLERLLDTHAVDSEPVRANYRRAMELEYDFFAACLS
ncbi:thiaminase (transcriptional activator TenA) [Enhydrobacter aerosaccus]|uniref:Thiaminase (Transcriptional activator TenA) n=1 Tax=Enhydrobacter aerosaccus TaxID=225324 RepID=A0A1T4SX45_9HYPH|nr:thiaminase (transcriptional activator TenA) [Enhydrobacter aerosaccus]